MCCIRAQFNRMRICPNKFTYLSNFLIQVFKIIKFVSEPGSENKMVTTYTKCCEEGTKDCEEVQYGGSVRVFTKQ